MDQCDNVPTQFDQNESGGSFERTILMWLIFGVLVAVIGLTTVLLFKLWSLEHELSVEAIPNYETLR